MIKVLWVSNILFPEAATLLIGKKGQRGSGGWLLASSKMLVEQNEFHLCVVTASSVVKSLTKIQGKKIIYYVFPICNSLKKYESYFKIINQEYQADIIHVHGTELPYGLACVKACNTNKVVVSIQGVMSEIAKYYLAGLSKKEIIRNMTLRDLFRGSIFQQERLFNKRGEQEKEVIRSVKHVIGRTTFDKAHVLSINPNVQYHFCNETLRPEFYKDSWQYDSCRKHSIFLSQTRYPVKGAHLLFEALPQLVGKYPDLEVYIAGENITKGKLRIKGTGYGLLLKNRIKKLKIEKHLCFMGALTAEEMKNTMLKSNVFVCPSSIENSSNSLGEAQLLGVPCVASYVGGLPSLITEKALGILYRFEDATMLAHAIEEVFENSNFDNSAMRQEARVRHNAAENLRRTIEIYNNVLKLN